MKLVNGQMLDQGNQSFGQMKSLEEKLEKEINNSVSKMKEIITNDDISRLNFSFSFLARITQAFPEDCTKVIRSYAKIQNTTGGDIYPESRDKLVEVYCDIVTDGGGWIVFQRRMNGTENFYREWNDYVNGFGEKNKEMWLGLETIHQLTKERSYELRVDLADFNGNTANAKYGTFSISSSSDRYRLILGEYSGTAGDSLTIHNNMQFSTKDSDNDKYSGSCAIDYGGAWWYNQCHLSNLNGMYYQDGRVITKSVNWYHWKLDRQSLKFSEMKFRKKQ
uniref:LOW QUALITY PROTEIN: fibrinogen-like protein A n=1 Tax=Styela clava TaxID=7725 RepID=UPI0019398ECA|nr:LOW QUALITY PROTEIN: fibrinogen-like protein A [Styela clava]